MGTYPYRDQSRVGIIRFNRPDKLNALNNLMREETLEQMGIWNENDTIGAIVLTGEGRSFCSGADLYDFANRVTQTRGTTPPTISNGSSAK